MTQRYVLGSIQVAVGLLFVLARQPLAEFQVGTGLRLVRAWKHAVPLSRAVFLLVGIGLIASGVLEMLDVAAWLAR